MINDEHKFEILFLKLQRSALIDTQTLFQIMIEKGICTLDEIMTAHETVEQNNPDVKRIDDQLFELTGEHIQPLISKKTLLLDQLQQLKAELMKNIQEQGSDKEDG